MTKYKIKKMLFAGTGILEIRWRSLSPGLYVFNYHRIGDSSKTAFDPNVFSCDEQHFEAQLETIRSRFRVINTSQLLDLIQNGSEITEPLAMITFDDGYADNYSKAFPMLAARDMPAIFFLPTSFIDATKIPWWDAAAWLVKNTDEKSLHLPDANSAIEIDASNVANSIRSVLRWFKDNPNGNSEKKLQLLVEACNKNLDSEAVSDLFMTWEQVRAMLDAGMDIGSHTQSHEILSGLSQVEQRRELTDSKRIIETAIGSTVTVLAYPVGGLDSYSSQTTEIAKECGYKAAFNFTKEGGYNADPKSNPYELVRIPVRNQATPIDIKISTLAASKIT